MLEVGESFSEHYRFTTQSIIELAGKLGDHNPLHHDQAFARASRFGGMIASASHASGVLIGVCATYLTTKFDAAGLQFDLRFARAVPAETDTTLAWTVTGIEPNAKLAGNLVTLQGTISDATGKVFVTCRAKAAVWEKKAQDGAAPVSAG